MLPPRIARYSVGYDTEVLRKGGFKKNVPCRWNTDGVRKRMSPVLIINRGIVRVCERMREWERETIMMMMMMMTNRHCMSRDTHLRERERERERLRKNQTVMMMMMMMMDRNCILSERERESRDFRNILELVVFTFFTFFPKSLSLSLSL